MANKKKNEEDLVFGYFMNTPGPQAVVFYELATKVMVARNLVTRPRKREDKPTKPKTGSPGKEAGAL